MKEASLSPVLIRSSEQLGYWWHIGHTLKFFFFSDAVYPINTLFEWHTTTFKLYQNLQE